MHIGFWSPAWPLCKHQNGIITYVHWMKCALEAQGHRVSVFTGEFDATSASPNVYIVRRSAGAGFARAFSDHVLRRSSPNRAIFEFGVDIGRAIKAVHQRDPLDIVEMEESFGWFADVARITSLPLVVKLHGPAFLSMVEDELFSPLGLERIEREGQALKRIDSIVAPSELILHQTLQKYGLQPKDARRIVNPVSMDERTPIWSRNGCDENSILFVGRFDLRKGGDVMLKAFASLVSRNKNLKLVFVGPDAGVAASDGKIIHFSEFCDSVIPAALRDRVDFRGRMSNDEIMSLRTQSMLTVIASRWENQGYALVEAMFQGCPVVSTDAGGCPESIKDGVTGLLAKSADPGSFSQKILAVIDNPVGAEALGRSARQFVIANHSAEKIVQSALQLYGQVISSHRI